MTTVAADGEEKSKALVFDTNALIFLLTNSSRLTAPARTAATRDDVARLFSAASIYEVALKSRLGKLPIDPSGFRQALRVGGFAVRSITEHVIYTAAMLDWPNRDPWDRIIGATARHEGGCLVSSDRAFDELPGISRLW